VNNNQARKICILTTSFPITSESNSGVFVYHLYKSLKKNHIVEVVTPDGKTATKPSKYDPHIFKFRYAPKHLQTLAHEPGGIPAALKQNSLNYLSIPTFVLSMLITTIYRATKNDLIQANWGICGYIANIAGLITNTPVITTFRGEDIGRASNSRIDKYFLDFCVKKSRYVVTVSEAFKSSLQNQYPQFQEKIFFIPNGVDLPKMPIERTPSPSETVKLLTVGSLITRKNQMQIIRSLALFPEVSRPRLTIVGEGNQRNTLEALINKLKINKYVDLAGEIPHCELPKIYQNNDIFILASYSEGRPNVVLEAMACSMPIVASNIDGTNELALDGKNALLFDKDSDNHLYTQINRLCKNSELRTSLGAAGRKMIMNKKLSWEQTAIKYEDLVSKACV